MTPSVQHSSELIQLFSFVEEFKVFLSQPNITIITSHRGNSLSALKLRYKVFYTQGSLRRGR